MKNSSLASDFLFSCISPVTVVDRLGNDRLVPCNKCFICRQRYMDRLATQCNIEVENCKHVYKLDLTYEEFNVPCCRIYPLHNDSSFKVYHLVDISKKQKLRYNVNTREYESYIDKSDTYGEIIDTIYIFNDDEEIKLFNEFVAKGQTLSKYYNRPFDVIRFCKSDDLQDFFKRLRKYISLHCDAKIRYFAVSEYGPTTFRPHFHIILYFNDDRLLSPFVGQKLRNRTKESAHKPTLLEKCIDDAWQYGDFIFERCRSQRTVAQYVTSYATSATHLPKYLRGKNIRPRAFHSQHLGCQALRKVRNYVYSQYNNFIFSKVSLFDGSSFFSLQFTKDIQSKLFPRCYRFSELNRTELYELYTIYNKVPQKIRQRYNLSRIVYYIIHHPVRFARFLRLMEIPICDITEVHLFRIYRQLLISRYFLRFCCEIYPSDYVLDVFINYRNALFSHQMGLMYSAQSDYYETTNNDDFTLFYDNDTFVESPYYDVYYNQQLSKYNDRVKHKVLNDQNKIFV